MESREAVDHPTHEIAARYASLRGSIAALTTLDACPTLVRTSLNDGLKELGTHLAASETDGTLDKAVRSIETLHDVLRLYGPTIPATGVVGDGFGAVLSSLSYLRACLHRIHLGDGITTETPWEQADQESRFRGSQSALGVAFDHVDLSVQTCIDVNGTSTGRYTRQIATIRARIATLRAKWQSALAAGADPSGIQDALLPVMDSYQDLRSEFVAVLANMSRTMEVKKTQPLRGPLREFADGLNKAQRDYEAVFSSVQALDDLLATCNQFMAEARYQHLTPDPAFFYEQLAACRERARDEQAVRGSARGGLSRRNRGDAPPPPTADHSVPAAYTTTEPAPAAQVPSPAPTSLAYAPVSYQPADIPAPTPSLPSSLHRALQEYVGGPPPTVSDIARQYSVESLRIATTPTHEAWLQYVASYSRGEAFAQRDAILLCEQYDRVYSLLTAELTQCDSELPSYQALTTPGRILTDDERADAHEWIALSRYCRILLTALEPILSEARGNVRGLTSTTATFSREAEALAAVLENVLTASATHTVADHHDTSTTHTVGEHPSVIDLTTDRSDDDLGEGSSGDPGPGGHGYGYGT